MTHHWGYIAAVSSALLFGIATTLNKLVLTDVHPTVVAGFIYLFAGLSLSVIRFSPVRGRVMIFLGMPSKARAGIGKRGLVVLALVVLSGSTIAPFLFFNGLNQTTAVDASLLQNTESLFTILLAFLFLKERTSRTAWLGILLLIGGVVFLTTNGEFNRLSLTQSLTGNLLIVGACFSWGIDNNLSKFLSKKEDLILVTILKCTIGGAILLSLSWAFGLKLAIPMSAFPYLVTVGALSIGFSILFFLLGLRRIGAMRTGIIFSTSSMFGATFAFLMLRESFSLLQLLAGLAMLVGVYVIYKKGD